MKKYMKFMFLTFLLLIMTGCNPSVKEVPYTDISYGTTVEQLTKQLNSKANKIEDEDGIDKYTYEKSTYMDYTGKMMYYMLDEAAIFTRWEYTAADENEGLEVYNTICEQMKTEYGEGVESDTDTMCVYTTQDSVIKTVLFTNDSNGCIVSITSAPGQGESEK